MIHSVITTRLLADTGQDPHPHGRMRVYPTPGQVTVHRAHRAGLPEQVAQEQLAAFSLLARWIDECTVETAQSD